MQDDLKHIKLLSIFHYVLGGLMALFSFFPIFHLAMGIAMLAGVLNDTGSGEGPPAFLGWIFVVIPAIMMLCGWALSICIIAAGRKLAKMKSRTYCIVIAAIECAFMPFGTVLGVFTIMILMKEPVKDLFETNSM